MRRKQSDELQLFAASADLVPFDAVEVPVE